MKEHYFDFNGHARHKEYWMFILVNIIISVMLSAAFDLVNEKLLLTANLYSLTALLPVLGVATRCLHDINESGWWVLIMLIPTAGLYLTYLLTKNSDAGQNQHGQSPKGIA